VTAGLGVVLPALRCCGCGSACIAACAPGDAGERAGDLFTVARPVALRAWCASCWPCLRRETEKFRRNI